MGTSSLLEEENEELRRELDSTLATLRRVREREACAAAALTGQDGTITQLRDALEDTIRDLEQSSREVESLREAVARWKSEARQSSRELQELRFQTDHVQDTIATLSATAKDLDCALEDGRHWKERCAFLERQISEMKAQHADTVRSLEQSVDNKSRVVAGLQEDIRALTAAMEMSATVVGTGVGGSGIGSGAGAGADTDTGIGLDAGSVGLGVDASSAALVADDPLSPAAKQLRLESMQRKLDDRAAEVEALQEDRATLLRLNHALQSVLDERDDRLDWGTLPDRVGPAGSSPAESLKGSIFSSSRLQACPPGGLSATKVGSARVGGYQAPASSGEGSATGTEPSLTAANDPSLRISLASFLERDVEAEEVFSKVESFVATSLGLSHLVGLKLDGNTADLATLIAAEDHDSDGGLVGSFHPAKRTLQSPGLQAASAALASGTLLHQARMVIDRQSLLALLADARREVIDVRSRLAAGLRDGLGHECAMQ